jgi:WD40 repeat protein
MTGEGSGKLLSHLSSKSGSSNTVQIIPVPCGGISDAAFSPDGSKLAVANRDGSVRLLDWASGVCIGGFRVSLGLRCSLCCVCYGAAEA